MNALTSPKASGFVVLRAFIGYMKKFLALARKCCVYFDGVEQHEMDIKRSVKSRFMIAPK